MSQVYEDRKLIFGMIGASVVTWNIILKIKQILENRQPELTEWIPVGRIKSLHVYPIKSCQGKNVFQYECTPLGAVSQEYFDRFFLVVDGETGKFHTARTKPQMVLIQTDIQDGIVTLSYPNLESVRFSVQSVVGPENLKQGFLHGKLRTDGYDCGQNVADFLSKIIEEPNTRLLMYQPDLFTERTCRTSETWWNNRVPNRVDDTAYADLAPFMITTQASLDDLNKHLKTPVTSTHFRPNIVVDDCEAWDEDKWQDLRIGEVELQCFKPCTRCILTTVDPQLGTKDSDMQPLRKLREIRLAPEGKMRKEFKDSPIFGVNAGVVRRGHIHVGQTVWAKYKKSAF
ncbi:unnamed protein product [Caenorhabditis angaria]|uniref:MOSC domain-containing protein n=1 Tax=Caenorhabditis angaria TaxID=860376 RepID=A0A9P1IS63_9PELO|nr:unnamed protein product [Caenorhabditis angaria]